MALSLYGNDLRKGHSLIIFLLNENLDKIQSIEQALQLHQAGDLSNAEDIYRTLLLDDPNHPVAMHLLAVIAHQGGKHEAAYNLT